MDVISIGTLRERYDSAYPIGEQLAAVRVGTRFYLLDRVSAADGTTGILGPNADRLAAIVAEGQIRIARGDYL